MYDIDNPKQVLNYLFPEELNFTGVVKDAANNIAYYQNGWHHRDDGPAIICCDGPIYYFKKGMLHREDGPAVIDPDGKKLYYVMHCNLPFSSDEELKEYCDLRKLDSFKKVRSYLDPGGFNFNGIVKDSHNTIAYYKNGKLHRDDGPGIA